MSSSLRIDIEKTKFFFILVKGPTQGLERTLNAENCFQSTLLNTIQNFV